MEKILRKNVKNVREILMFGDIPVEISPMYEGERIRAANMFVELGGPKSVGAELVLVSENVEDGKVTVIGPEIRDMEEGNRNNFV